MRFEFDHDPPGIPRMVVMGVGGAGGNAINRMLSVQVTGVEFIAANTDVQALEHSAAPNKLRLGANVTRGRGAGSNPELGRRAAEEARDLIAEALANAEMVFVTAGMGGGTGTGAAPIVAQTAKQQGALTVAVVTKPFLFEGRKRMANALDGIAELKQQVDTLIVIPNERLLAVVGRDTSVVEAFQMADEILLHAVRGISDLIARPGLINLDFADVCAIMAGMGDALMGTGFAQGQDRAVNAAQQAISNPLLDDISIAGAQGILVNYTGGTNLALHELSEATSLIGDAAGPEAKIIFGVVLDDNMSDDVRVTVIATGFDAQERKTATEAAAKLVSFRRPKYSSRAYERPAFQRKQTEEVKEVASGTDGIALSMNDLEVPTFLRRQKG